MKRHIETIGKLAEDIAKANKDNANPFYSRAIINLDAAKTALEASEKANPPQPAKPEPPKPEPSPSGPKGK